MPMLSELEPRTVFRCVEPSEYGSIGVTPDVTAFGMGRVRVLGVLMHSPDGVRAGTTLLLDREVEIIPGGIRFEGLD